MALKDAKRNADAKALAAFVAGQEGAAEALTSLFAPQAYALALRMLGDRYEAEDIAQEAMMKLWKIAPQWQAGRARISTWLYRVTANLCTDRLRKRGRMRPVEDAGDPADPAPGAAEGMQQASRSAALSAALLTLPANQRLAVTLRHLEERGNPEIAEIMGLSVEAVESLIARGKRGLRSALEDRRESLSYRDS